MRTLPILLLALAAAASAEEVFLHSIPLAVEAGADPDRLDTLQVATETAAYAPRRLSPYPSANIEGPTAFLGASFVIDFDEPSVEVLRAKLVEAHGASPSLAALVRFTHDFIASKGLDRGFELAHRSLGMPRAITEHAVLLTVLARATGRPARVLLGVALLREPGSVPAYGHAWSEIHIDREWHVGGATGLRDGDILSYIAIAPLRDEGPGYSLPLIEALGSAWFKGVQISVVQSDS
jgi:hypothetical protein